LEILAEDHFPGGPSSPALLGRIDALLGKIGYKPGQLERLIATRGPGSFTGLRSSLATLVGLAQSLQIPATAVSTFRPLARQAPIEGRIVAAVDALRSEWFVQAYEAPSWSPSGGSEILPVEQILKLAPCRIVAFGSERIAHTVAQSGMPPKNVSVQEAQPLAKDLLAIALEGALEWNQRLLTSPLYLRPPAVAAVRTPA
jgi:tRNA threonylcarbamoyladenosine biosynthesis protein TsaB